MGIYIGFDPGLSGAIAGYRRDGDEVVGAKVVKMPPEPAGIREAIVELHRNLMDCGDDLPTISVERITARLGDNPDGTKRKIGLASMAKLIRNAGHIEGVLAGMELEFRLVQPRMWQKEFGLLMPRKEYPDRSPDWIYREKKRRNRDRAAVEFPSIRATLWNGDAFMVALWGEAMDIKELDRS
jgi:hypothetical protein